MKCGPESPGQEVKMADWKCKECGYTVNSDLPPEKCPSCKKKCEFVDISCYMLAVLQKCLKKGRLKMLFEEWG